MSEELGKICRVCLSEGSRDIFYNRNTNTDTVSSLDRILEKYRFVTMLQTHEADFLPRMLCDTCIVSLNVAYNFKKRAIDADSKLRQYVIEKGIGLPEPSYDTGYNLAITDGRGSSSVSNFLDTTHSLGGFAVPEPLRQSSLHPETTALAHEYLRNFETPQSMASTSVAQIKTNNSLTDRFRCMPIQIKVEQIDPGTYQISPTGSEENLQTVSDTSSIRSAMNRIPTVTNPNHLASVSDHLAHCSDEEFVNHYLRPSPEQKKTKESYSDKSPASSKSSGTNKSSTTVETNSTNTSSTTNTKDTMDKNHVSSDAEKLKKPSSKAVKATVYKAETEKTKTKESNEKSKQKDESKKSKKGNRDLHNLGDTPVLSSNRKRTQANKFTSDEPVEKKSRNVSVKPRNRSQVSTETKSETSNKRGARNSTRKTSSGRTATEKKTPLKNKSSNKKNDAKVEKSNKSQKPKSSSNSPKASSRGKGVVTPKKLTQRS